MKIKLLIYIINMTLFSAAFANDSETNINKCLSYCNDYFGQDFLEQKQLKIISTNYPSHLDDSVKPACSVPFYLGSLASEVLDEVAIEIDHLFVNKDGDVNLIAKGKLEDSCNQTDVFKKSAHFISKELMEKEVKKLNLKRCVIKYPHTDVNNGKVSFKILFDEVDKLSFIKKVVHDENSNELIPYITGLAPKNMYFDIEQAMKESLQTFINKGICQAIEQAQPAQGTNL